MRTKAGWESRPTVDNTIKPWGSNEVIGEKDNKITFTLPDKRMVQPICFKNEGQEGINRLQQTELFRKNKKNYKFFSSNNISLFVSITKRELNAAKCIFKDLIAKKTEISSEIIFDGEELKVLFDYFEHIQTSIIFSYTAVEAFSNAAIPNNFVIEKINNKCVKETWNKRNIER